MAEALVARLARRLGIARPDVIGKAAEYERLSKLKASAKELSDAAAAVVALDLASSTLGVEFDSEFALTLSGLKKSAYFNAKHTVAKLLDVGGALDVDSLCVQLGCGAEARDTALRILDSYARTNPTFDSTHPQFACIAVYLACKKHKVKVPKQKFSSRCCLKPGQWKALENEWKSFVDVKTERKKKLTADVTPAYDIDIDSNDVESVSAIDEVEEYETWKERILREAYAEISQRADTEESDVFKGGVSLFFNC